MVAKGFSQEYGIDYDETFGPIANITIVCVLIYVAVAQQWYLLQLDVKNAILEGSLSEEVSMRPLPSFSSPPSLVCRLCRPMYSLNVVLGIGFQSSTHDSMLFIHRTYDGIVLLLLYVDGIIITGSNASAISKVKQWLFSELEMKNLGLLRYFLGIQVASSPKGYLLFQFKYENENISRAKLTNDKVVDTPIELHAKFSPTDGVPLDDPTVYWELVDCLVYLTMTNALTLPMWSMWSINLSLLPFLLIG